MLDILLVHCHTSSKELINEIISGRVFMTKTKHNTPAKIQMSMGIKTMSMRSSLADEVISVPTDMAFPGRQVCFAKIVTQVQHAAD